MRSRGISDFPDPQVSSNGGAVRISITGINSAPNSDLNPNNPQFQAAHNACQSLLPRGGGPQDAQTGSPGGPKG
jgi:hypothetical protein